MKLVLLEKHWFQFQFQLDARSTQMIQAAGSTDPHDNQPSSDDESDVGDAEAPPPLPTSEVVVLQPSSSSGAAPTPVVNGSEQVDPRPPATAESTVPPAPSMTAAAAEATAPEGNRVGLGEWSWVVWSGTGFMHYWKTFCYKHKMVHPHPQTGCNQFQAMPMQISAFHPDWPKLRSVWKSFFVILIGAMFWRDCWLFKAIILFADFSKRFFIPNIFWGLNVTLYMYSWHSCWYPRLRAARLALDLQRQSGTAGHSPVEVPGLYI